MLFSNSLRHYTILLIGLGLFCLFQSCGHSSQTAEEKEKESILIFAGAASLPPAEKLAKLFEEETGIRAELVFGGSGFVLAQMKLTGKGDVFFPGSSDFMELALEEGLVDIETVQPVVFLVPAINVPKGNPKNITNLSDLGKPGLKVAIANPAQVCVGLYAVEILENNLSSSEIEQVKKNLVTLPESCEKTANVVALSTVDAVLGWSVFEAWNPSLIETIPLKAEAVKRVGFIPAGIVSKSAKKPAAQAFINFITGPAGKKVFKEHGYFTEMEAAFRYIGATKPVGGLYPLPESWQSTK